MTLSRASRLARAKPDLSWTKSAQALLRTPHLKADTDAVLFSAKSYAAAVASYYIALSIGLPRPTGRSSPSTSSGTWPPPVGRGVYRLAGTLVGAGDRGDRPHFRERAARVQLGARETGLGCVCISPCSSFSRAYAFVLAGYTASLIDFPSVS